MQQKAYNKVEDVLAAATQLSAGAATHAVALGLVVATKPLIDAEVNALTAAITALRDGKQTLRGLRNTFTAKQKVAFDLASTVRDHLKRSLGRSYSPQWDGTGFTRSLEIPRKVAALEVVLLHVKEFLADNPAYELENIATAALVDTALTDLSSARTAVQLQKTAVRGLVKARQGKEQAIRARIRGVVEELKRVIGPIDPRWEAFGLNQPGIKQVPTVPGKVTLVLASNNAVTVKWGPVPRADYYRVWVKVQGRDQDFVEAGNSSEASFTIEDLPANSDVEISVSAANNGGESARSEVSKVKTV